MLAWRRPRVWLARRLTPYTLDVLPPEVSLFRDIRDVLPRMQRRLLRSCYKTGKRKWMVMDARGAHGGVRRRAPSRRGVRAAGDARRPGMVSCIVFSDRGEQYMFLIAYIAVENIMR